MLLNSESFKKYVKNLLQSSDFFERNQFFFVVMNIFKAGGDLLEKFSHVNMLYINMRKLFKLEDFFNTYLTFKVVTQKF